MRLHAPTRRVSQHHFRKPYHALTAGSLFAALLLALTLLGTTTGVAQAQGSVAPTGRAPGGRLSDPVVRAVDLAAPAVVRIATVYASHIALTVCGANVTLPHGASGYIEGALGSGAFISAHGDILTADHLIQVDHDLLEQELFADPAAQADIAHALNSSPCYGFGPAITTGDISAGFLQLLGIEYHTTFDSPTTSVWRDTSYSGALSYASGDKTDILQALMSVSHLRATTLKSSDFNHDDLAVLHVDAQNTPSIRLDDSASVQALDTLTVIGFPGNGDANNEPTNLLTPSFNQASVSAIKANTDGAQLIQAGGNIEHGDSGGPALDSAGRIVGVVSFGGSDNQGITAFLRSSDSARGLIALAHVDMQPGPFELAWERAFGDYAATYSGHWRRSSQEFAALLTAYPQFKGAAPYAGWAQAQARVEPQPQRQLTSTSTILAALATLDLAMIALTLFRAARGRPRARQKRSMRAIGQREPADASDGQPLTQDSDSAQLEARDDERVHSSRDLN